MIRAALVLALSFAGCGSDEPGAERAQPAARGNFVLYVSNQSFARSTVDIRVEVDGHEVVSESFAVENQHNWVEYRIRLARGTHVIRAASSTGEAVFERSFPIRGRTWAVIDYWCCDGPDEPRFTFHISREPIAFA
jgi:hypothetical protein